MRRRIEQTIGAVRSLNKAVHFVAGGTMLVMLALTVAEILGRWLLNSPVAGAVETIPLMLVMVVFFGLPHAQHRGDHIAVELVYWRLDRKMRRRLSIGSHLFSLVALAFVTWALWEYAGVQHDGGYATAVIGWPIHWFVRMAAFGSALLWMATAAEAVAELVGMDGREWRPVNRSERRRSGPSGSAS